MLALSYSFINDYLNCPHKVYRTKVAKDIPFTETKEIKWGNVVHKGFENAIKNREELPKELPYQAYLNALNRLGRPMEAELQLAADENLKMVDWFSKIALYRAKIDVFIRANNEAVLVDWKTGSSRYEEQNKLELEIQAFLLQILYPEINNITGYFIWLKDKRVGKKYSLNNWNKTHSFLTRIQTEIQSRKTPEDWTMKPNPLCAWCPVLDCKWNKNK